MPGYDSTCMTYSLIDLDTSTTPDISVFKLDSTHREIQVSSSDTSKAKDYLLELQGKITVNSVIENVVFVVSVLDPCDFTTITPSNVSNPIIYSLYDMALNIVLEFSSSEDLCGSFTYSIEDLDTLTVPDSSVFTLTGNTLSIQTNDINKTQDYHI